MRFISLIDTKNQNIITIDADSLVLRLEIDGIPKETRLKSYMASVLYELFSKHPAPLSYEKITELLKQHHLIVSDFTRMHRKLSEIRQFVSKFHQTLNNLILNTRGVGYSLPLCLKNLHQMDNKDNTIFKNKKMNKPIEILHGLINDAIDMTAQNKVMRHTQGYVISRDSVREVLIEKISVFTECEKIILKEICAHEADFTALRIAYLLAKLKTYVGLARISEYPLSETQWSDWFKQEVWLIFDELKKLIKFSENL